MRWRYTFGFAYRQLGFSVRYASWAAFIPARTLGGIGSSVHAIQMRSGIRMISARCSIDKVSMFLRNSRYSRSWSLGVCVTSCRSGKNSMDLMSDNMNAIPSITRRGGSAWFWDHDSKSGRPSIFPTNNGSLIPSDGNIVKTTVIGSDPTGEKKTRADRVSKYMSYQILKEMDGWEEDMDKLLIMLPIVGMEKSNWGRVLQADYSTSHPKCDLQNEFHRPFFPTHHWD